jgi:hypothetical protein
MVWLNWFLTHPGEVMQVLKLGFQIAHKLAIKRRRKRIAKKQAEEEEERQKIYRYSGTKEKPGL